MKVLHLYGVILVQIAKLRLSKSQFLIQQEVHLTSLRVYCSLMVELSGQEMVFTLVLKVLMILYWTLLQNTQLL